MTELINIIGARGGTTDFIPHGPRQKLIGG